MTYIVHIKPDGHTFFVNEGETVLSAALRQGYRFPYSCRSAICSACKGRLLEGKVSYQETMLFGLMDEERELGYALFCSAIPQSDLVVEIEGVLGPTQVPVTQARYQVQQFNKLADNVYQVWMMPTQGERIAYRAGQYLEILHQDQSPRPFSIANAPVENGLLELHIRHVANNPYTQQIINEIEQYGVLHVAGPYGQAILRPELNYPYLFIAGGTGFAPIKALLESALSAGVSKPCYLYWGVRNEADLYLSALPRQWQQVWPHFRFIPVVSGLTDKGWQGRRGLVHDAVLEDHPLLSQFQVYAAGPTEMVYAALHRFERHGLKRALMYSDAFDRP